jgi:hypothetical protein
MTMALQTPRGAERDYLMILGIAAIYGAQLPIGTGFIGVSRDLNLSLQSLKRRFVGAEIVFSLWVRDRETAEALRRKANARISPSRSAEAMRCAIEEVAGEHHIVLTEHDVVMARVSAVVRTIDDAIEQARQNGELHWFNTTFREWRLAARSQGRVMTYSEAKARLRRAVIQLAVSEQTFCERLPAIFPKLAGLNFD